MTLWCSADEATALQHYATQVANADKSEKMTFH